MSPPRRAGGIQRRRSDMEAALNGLSNTVKHQPTKEAVAQAKEAVKSLSSSEGSVSIPYVREKCLAAFELVFDKGNDKAAHYAVEGVQVFTGNFDLFLLRLTAKIRLRLSVQKVVLRILGRN
ncbi:hypothetical protein TELCIR_25008 [Teladorsagia circumcincta]|uniref:Mon2/Sec7/BIG1-like dimerisation and cyclophilin-binding domain-containing protein n=1 Tax=Teladorsagia circumcincta TaxID=45464 RepID=A0A2G9T8C8_TELCI|nr:hypothetical protein TELCIR_25008 [Teladorsagia circumcincta]